MRLVIQRVKFCNVYIDSKIFSAINKGIICYVGVSKKDTLDIIEWASKKIIGLRIFENKNEKMDKSVKDIDGDIMLIPQFTLFGDVKKGQRPSFSDAAEIENSKQIYEKLVDFTKISYDKYKVQSGVFQAMMEVEYINDGPVTILIDSEKNF